MLGILPMNALAFGLASAAYLNVEADGTRTGLDRVIGVLTMVFVDQKMMALFSLLFGVGVVVFADRARAKGRRVVWLSLWRFALLLVIGIAHTMLWEGDVLVLYAMSAPIVLAMRRLPVRVLVVAGVLLALVGSLTAPLFEATVSADGHELGDLWFADGDEMSAAVQTWFYSNAAGRALGLMLIGVALFRLGIMQGARSEAFYRRLAGWGLGFGTSITIAGLVWRVATDWSPDHALTGHIPTGIGTIPMALGYLAVIILWNRRGGGFVERLRCTGRMALTNYLDPDRARRHDARLVARRRRPHPHCDRRLDRRRVGAPTVVVDVVAGPVQVRPRRVGLAQRHLPRSPTVATALGHHHLRTPRQHTPTAADDQPWLVTAARFEVSGRCLAASPIGWVLGRGSFAAMHRRRSDPHRWPVPTPPDTTGARCCGVRAPG